MTLSIDVEERRGRIGLWLVAALLFLVLAFVVWRFVGAIVLGIFAYYVTRPIFRRIHERIPNRTLAVAVSIVTVALPAILLVGWTIALLVRQLSQFVQSAAFDRVLSRFSPYGDLSTVARELGTQIRAVLADPGQLTSLGLGESLGAVLGSLVASFAVVGTVLLQLFVVLVITFYLLRDDHKIAAWARATVAPEGGIVDDYLVEVDHDLKSVYFGNILNAVVTGILGAVVYSLLNLVAPGSVPIPQPVLLGLLAGVGSLIPVIGMKLVWVPVALVLLVDSLLTDPATVWFPLLFALVSTVIVDYIPDQLLRPYLSGRNLHVGAVMLAYVFGPLAFGWYGIFLGPLLLVLVFEFFRIVFPWLVDPEAG